MDDSPTSPDSDDPSAEGLSPRPQSAPRTPRWVVVLGVLALVLILAAVVQLVFGISHGPGLHALP